jgi:SPP1 gp7 family putative phage head morphogenesis protein
MTMLIDFKNVEILIDKKLKLSEKILVKSLKQSYNEIMITMDNIYKKYSKDGKLTINEMYKFKRLQQLERNIYSILDNSKLIQRSELLKIAESSFSTSYRECFKLINQQFDDYFVWMPPSKAVINASVQNKIGKMTLNQRLAKNKRIIKKRIMQDITTGIIKGDSYKQIAKRISSVLNYDLNKALRVARTETHRNQMTGRFNTLENLKNQGAKIKKIWLSAIDTRTRDSHIYLNQQKKDFDDLFIGLHGRGLYPSMLNHPKEDINCRCTYITDIKLD